MVFEICDKLTSLHLANVPQLNWAACKAAAQMWPDKPLTKLHVHGVNLDEEFVHVISRLPHLRQLELDGPARILKAASVSWWVSDADCLPLL